MATNKEVSVSIPGVWALSELLGPVFDGMRQDIAQLYRVGVERITSQVTNVQEIAVGESFALGHRRTLAALAAEAACNHKEAIRLWTVTFGEDFPAYG